MIMSRRKKKDSHTILAEYLMKYGDLETVLEEKDERLLFDILKYEANLTHKEFDETYSMAIKAGIALARCRHCGEELEINIGQRGSHRKFCDNDKKCSLAVQKGKVAEQQKRKHLSLLRRKIKNIRQRMRRA
jgi:hypothetical protein